MSQKSGDNIKIDSKMKRYDKLESPKKAMSPYDISRKVSLLHNEDLANEIKSSKS
jgi:hypothetical protein